MRVTFKMNAIKEYKKQRKAISPIIATVLIIAVTLVASVAIGGFVFGLFGSATSTAQVQATVATIQSTVASAAAFSVSCATGAPTNNYIALYNQGTAATTVSLVSLTFSGITMSIAPTGGTNCSVNSGTTVYISIGQVLNTAVATKGLQFTGYAATANGAQVVFTGAFS